MILVNGQAAQTVAVAERALQFGDGVFETIAVKKARPLCLPEHLRRLRRGCESLRIAPPDEAVLEAEVDAALAPRRDAIVKIIVSRGESRYGYAVPAAARPTRIVAAYPWPAAGFAVTLRVCLCETRLARNPRLAGIKHLNRLEQVLARREVDARQRDEGIVLDTAGNVIEGAGGNLFLLLGGELVTPDLEQCGIAGVVREKILDMGGTSLPPVIVRKTRRAELEQAEEMFFTNSIRGIQSVADYGGRRLPSSALAARIRSELVKRQVILQ